MHITNGEVLRLESYCDSASADTEVMTRQQRHRVSTGSGATEATKLGTIQSYVWQTVPSTALLRCSVPPHTKYAKFYDTEQ